MKKLNIKVKPKYGFTTSKKETKKKETKKN
jgi:hypothetical protein